MAAASDYLETQMLKWALTGNTVTRPATWYIALYTAAPTDAGGGTEVSTTGTAYARQTIAFTVTGNSATNSAIITFPTATANWGTVTHIGIFDTLTAGNLLYWGTAAASKTITTGDTMQVNASNVTITLD